MGYPQLVQKPVGNMEELRVMISSPYKTLLKRYGAVINKKLKERGAPPVPISQLGGAIISFLLEHHAEAIVDEASRLQVDDFRRRYQHFGRFAESPGADEDAHVRGTRRARPAQGPTEA